MLKLLPKLFGFGFAMFGVLWMFIAGGYGVYWYDRRPEGFPKPIVMHLLFFKQSFGLPKSLKAQLLDAQGDYRTALAQAAQRQANVVAISNAAGEAEDKSQTTIRVVYRNIIQKVPYAITPAVDHSFPLSRGFVRLYNLSVDPASAVDANAPTGQPDDAASPVAESRFSQIAVQNNGTCAETAERLTALQSWVVQSQAALSKR